MTSISEIANESQIGDFVNLSNNSLNMTDKVREFVEWLRDSGVGKLFLDNCGMNDVTVMPLLQYLRGSNDLVMLSLRDNRIGPLGGKALARLLKQNAHVKTVNILGNGFEESAEEIVKNFLESTCESLCGLWDRHQSIVLKRLTGSDLYIVSGELQKSKHLATLEILGDIMVDPADAIVSDSMTTFCSGLQDNTSLLLLKWSHFPFAHWAVPAFAKAIRANSALKSLDISIKDDSVVNAKDLALIMNAIGDNTSITSLRIKNFPNHKSTYALLAQMLSASTTLLHVCLFDQKLSVRDVKEIAEAVACNHTLRMITFTGKNSNVTPGIAKELISVASSKHTPLAIYMDQSPRDIVNGKEDRTAVEGQTGRDDMPLTVGESILEVDTMVTIKSHGNGSQPQPGRILALHSGDKYDIECVDGAVRSGMPFSQLCVGAIEPESPQTPVQGARDDVPGDSDGVGNQADENRSEDESKTTSTKATVARPDNNKLSLLKKRKPYAGRNAGIVDRGDYSDEGKSLSRKDVDEKKQGAIYIEDAVESFGDDTKSRIATPQKSESKRSVPSSCQSSPRGEGHTAGAGVKGKKSPVRSQRSSSPGAKGSKGAASILSPRSPRSQTGEAKLSLEERVLEAFRETSDKSSPRPEMFITDSKVPSPSTSPSKASDKQSGSGHKRSRVPGKGLIDSIKATAKSIGNMASRSTSQTPSVTAASPAPSPRRDAYPNAGEEDATAKRSAVSTPRALHEEKGSGESKNGKSKSPATSEKGDVTEISNERKSSNNTGSRTEKVLMNMEVEMKFYGDQMWYPGVVTRRYGAGISLYDVSLFDGAVEYEVEGHMVRPLTQPAGDAVDSAGSAATDSDPDGAYVRGDYVEVCEIVVTESNDDRPTTRNAASPRNPRFIERNPARNETRAHPIAGDNRSPTSHEDRETSEKWTRGRVIGLYDSGYAVRMQDGRDASCVSGKDMRYCFRVNDEVDCRLSKSPQWVRGRIVKVEGAGMYSAIFHNDAKIYASIPARRLMFAFREEVRLIAAKLIRPSSKQTKSYRPDDIDAQEVFVVNDRVEVLHGRNSWLEARILWYSAEACAYIVKYPDGVIHSDVPQNCIRPIERVQTRKQGTPQPNLDTSLTVVSFHDIAKAKMRINDVRNTQGVRAGRHGNRETGTALLSQSISKLSSSDTDFGAYEQPQRPLRNHQNGNREIQRSSRPMEPRYDGTNGRAEEWNRVPNAVLKEDTESSVESFNMHKQALERVTKSYGPSDEHEQNTIRTNRLLKRIPSISESPPIKIREVKTSPVKKDVLHSDAMNEEFMYAVDELKAEEDRGEFLDGRELTSSVPADLTKDFEMYKDEISRTAMPTGSASPSKEYKEGNAVYVKFTGSSKHEQAEIVKDHRDGTYTVQAIERRGRERVSLTMMLLEWEYRAGKTRNTKAAPQPYLYASTSKHMSPSKGGQLEKSILVPHVISSFQSTSTSDSIASPTDPRIEVGGKLIPGCHVTPSPPANGRPSPNTSAGSAASKRTNVDQRASHVEVSPRIDVQKPAEVDVRTEKRMSDLTLESMGEASDADYCTLDAIKRRIPQRLASIEDSDDEEIGSEFEQTKPGFRASRIQQKSSARLTNARFAANMEVQTENANMLQRMPGGYHHESVETPMSTNTSAPASSPMRVVSGDSGMQFGAKYYPAVYRDAWTPLIVFADDPSYVNGSKECKYLRDTGRMTPRTCSAELKKGTDITVVIESPYMHFESGFSINVMFWDDARCFLPFFGVLKRDALKDSRGNVTFPVKIHFYVKALLVSVVTVHMRYSPKLVLQMADPGMIKKQHLTSSVNEQNMRSSGSPWRRDRERNNALMGKGQENVCSMFRTLYLVSPTPSPTPPCLSVGRRSDSMTKHISPEGAILADAPKHVPALKIFKSTGDLESSSKLIRRADYVQFLYLQLAHSDVDAEAHDEVDSTDATMAALKERSMQMQRAEVSFGLSVMPSYVVQQTKASFTLPLLPSSSESPHSSVQTYPSECAAFPRTNIAPCPTIPIYRWMHSSSVDDTLRGLRCRLYDLSISLTRAMTSTAEKAVPQGVLYLPQCGVLADDKEIIGSTLCPANKDCFDKGFLAEFTSLAKLPESLNESIHKGPSDEVKDGRDEKCDKNCDDPTVSDQSRLQERWMLLFLHDDFDAPTGTQQPANAPSYAQYSLASKFENVCLTKGLDFDLAYDAYPMLKATVAVLLYTKLARFTSSAELPSPFKRLRDEDAIAFKSLLFLSDLYDEMYKEAVRRRNPKRRSGKWEYVSRWRQVNDLEVLIANLNDEKAGGNQVRSQNQDNGSAIDMDIDTVYAEYEERLTEIVVSYCEETMVEFRKSGPFDAAERIAVRLSDSDGANDDVDGIGSHGQRRYEYQDGWCDMVSEVNLLGHTHWVDQAARMWLWSPLLQLAKHVQVSSDPAEKT
jgi:hypothetical protein